MLTCPDGRNEKQHDLYFGKLRDTFLLIPIKSTTFGSQSLYKQLNHEKVRNIHTIINNYYTLFLQQQHHAYKFR